MQQKAKALRKQLAEREAIERQRDEEKALAESLKNGLFLFVN